MNKVEIISIGGVNMDICATIQNFPGLDEEVEIIDLQELPGGSAANYIVGVSRLGVSSGFIGRIGNDSYGERLKSDFLREGVDISQLKTTDFHSGTALIPIDKQGNRLIFSFLGANATLIPADIEVHYLTQASLLHITSPPIEIATYTAELARKNHIILSYDPGGKVIRKGLAYIEPILRNTDIFLPSKSELFQLFPESKDPVTTAQKLINSYGIRIVVVKTGSDGCIIITEETVLRVQGFKVQTIDTTGAGDCFAAAFTVGFYKKWSLPNCARFANAAAALKVTRLGARTGLPTLQEVEAFLEKKQA